MASSFSIFTYQLCTLYSQVSADASVVQLKLLEALHLIVQKDPAGHFLDCLLELKARPRKDLKLFMNAHYDKPLDVDDFARLSGRSISTFRRDFHGQFGVAPKKWLIRKRLDKAKMLLNQGDQTVNTVAMQSGYSDLPHFIKSFQKEFDISPKQYALSQRN